MKGEVDPQRRLLIIQVKLQPLQAPLRKVKTLTAGEIADVDGVLKRMALLSLSPISGKLMVQTLLVPPETPTS